MFNPSLDPVLEHVRRLLPESAGEVAGDAELLRRFNSERDESAFATLLDRHGPLVLGVCRRLLMHTQDAEDAFQATFLVLVCKATTLRQWGSLANYLHTIAHRLALKVKVRSDRRRALEQPIEAHEPARQDSGSDPGLRAVLDEELARLPEKYRAPLVLCYLEGLTHSEAAGQLGWKEGTVCGRLARGKDLLRRRLARRGLAPSVAVLDGVLAPEPLTTALAEASLQAARQLASGKGLELGGAQVAGLVQQTLRAMRLDQVKFVAVLLVCGLGAGLGLATLAWSGQRKHSASAAPATHGHTVHRDRHGDPLPPGALARLGASRFRHGGPIETVSYSPDGTMLASSGSDDVFLWDSKTGKQHRHFAGHTCACFSPAGQVLATGAQGQVYLWATATGELIRRIPQGDSLPVGRMAFSPDGGTLTTVTRQMIRSYEVKTGKDRGRPRPLPKAIQQFSGMHHAFALSPSGEAIAWHVDGSPVELLYTGTGKRVTLLPKGQPHYRSPLTFSADGKTLASAVDGTVYLWDVASGAQRGRFSTGYYPWTVAVAFSADGKRLASAGFTDMRKGGQKLIVTLHELATGKATHQFRPDEYRSRGACGRFDLSLAFAPDGKSVVAWAATDHALHIWDVATGKALVPLGGVYDLFERISFSSDGRTLAASIRGESFLRLWDAGTGRELRQLHGHGGLIQAFAFSPNGRFLASGSDNDPRIRFWEVITGKELTPLPGHSGPKNGFSSDQVHFLAFCPDGTTLVSAGHDGAIRLWDWPRRTELKRINLPGGASGVYLAPNGRTALTQKNEHSCVQDLPSGKRLMQGKFSAWHVSLATFSPDSRTLACRASDGALQFWDVASGVLLRSLPVPCSNWSCLAFSPDGKTLAEGSWQGDSVRLWDVASTRGVGRFVTGQGGITGLAYSPDGTKLVTAGKNATALVWDTKSYLPPAPAVTVERTLRELEKAWQDLGNSYESSAAAAMWALVASPRQSVPFLRRRLLAAAPAAERDRRAVAALEHIGNPEARQLLEELARSNPELERTREAKAALGRLPQR
jgi:RNA polymerase sigma factor (sigma-70 family)